MHTESTLFLCVIFFVLLLKWSQHFVFQLRNASKSKQSKFRCTINRLIPLHNCSKQWRSWPFAATADEHGKTNERTSTTTATWTASRLIRQKGIHKSSKHCYVYIATTLRIINKTNETGGAEARLTNINHSSCVFVCLCVAHTITQRCDISSKHIHTQIAARHLVSFAFRWRARYIAWHIRARFVKPLPAYTHHVASVSRARRIKLPTPTFRRQ